MANTIDELMREYSRLEELVNNASSEKKKVDEQAKIVKKDIDQSTKSARLKLKSLSRLIALYGQEIELPGLDQIVSLSKPRRSFSPEQKAEGVALAKKLGSVPRAAEELGIHSTVLRNWIIKASEDKKEEK